MTERMQTDPTLAGSKLVVPPESYALPGRRLDELEQGLVVELRDAGVQTGVVNVLAGPATEIADFARTTESNIFTRNMGEGYNFHAGMAPYEGRSQFLLTVDVDAGTIPHAKRLVFARSEDQQAATGLTGIEIFDDRLSAPEDERLDLPTILGHHKIKRPEECVNVTTNEITERGPAPTFERPYTLISYKAVFELCRALGVSFVTAYLNNGATKSLGKAGVQHQLLGGKEFHLPIPAGTEVDEDSEKYDRKYVAVVIPADDHNVGVFTKGDSAYRLSQLIARLEIRIFEKQGSTSLAPVELPQ